MQLSRMSTFQLAGAAIVAAMVVHVLSPYSVLRGDVEIFAEHAAAILDGAIPYLDVDMEHLPLSVVPILVAGIAEKAGLPYDVAFVGISGLAVVLIALVVDRIGQQTGDPIAGRRWVLVAVPLFPIVL